MKTTFIAKAIPVVIGCSILAIFLVPTGFAYKTGIGSHEAAPKTSCNSTPGNLTIFPFARLKMNTNGSATGIEVHLSNADSDCKEMIYSSYEVGYGNDSGTILDNNGRAIVLR